MNSLTESGQQLTTSEGKQTQKERGLIWRQPTRSLRRYDPNQVQRVALTKGQNSQSKIGHPRGTPSMTFCPVWSRLRACA